MSTCPTFYGVDDAEIRELADALVLLYTECKKTWNEDGVISIIEELSGTKCYVTWSLIRMRLVFILGPEFEG